MSWERRLENSGGGVKFGRGDTFIIHPWCLLSCEGRFWIKTPGFSPPPSWIPLHGKIDITFLICEKKTQSCPPPSSFLWGAACLQGASIVHWYSCWNPPSSPGETCGTSAVSMPGWNILPCQESMLGSHISSHVRDTFSRARPSIPMGACLWKVYVCYFLTSCGNKARSPPSLRGGLEVNLGCNHKAPAVCLLSRDPYSLTSTYCTCHTG